MLVTSDANDDSTEHRNDASSLFGGRPEPNGKAQLDWLKKRCNHHNERDDVDDLQ